jgi:mono/diheme cytochrome c family protein
MRLRLSYQILVLAVANCSFALAASGPASNPEQIQQGRTLFLERGCSHCHGHDGTSGVKLAGRDDLTPDYVLSTIKEGKKSGGRVMPPWGSILSDGEIQALVAYLMSIQNAQNPP